MAILSGNVIGNLSGKLGNLAARTVYGQTIMSARPSSFNVSYSDALVAARQKFAVTGAFAKAVLDSLNLSEIWDKVRIQGLSTFNTVFKANYSYSSPLQPTISNILTPDGFTMPVQSHNMDGLKLSFVINPFNATNVFSPEEVAASFSALIVLHTPHSLDDPAFRIINLEKEVSSFNFTTVYTAELPLNTFQTALLNKYSKYIYMVACATKSAEGKIIQHSETYAVET